MGEFPDETAADISDPESIDTQSAESDVDVEVLDESSESSVAAGSDDDVHDQSDASVESALDVGEVGGVDPHQVLDTLHERPVAEHAEVYEELHTHLQRTLAEIDGG